MANLVKIPSGSVEYPYYLYINPDSVVAVIDYDLLENGVHYQWSKILFSQPIFSGDAIASPMSKEDVVALFNAAM